MIAINPTVKITSAPTKITRSDGVSLLWSVLCFNNGDPFFMIFNFT
jgi:hypothetical protein